MTQLFGTDGIRGMANTFPMTSEIAMATGKAVAHLLLTRPNLAGESSFPIGLKPLESNRKVRRPRVVVGKDTRLSGYMIENAIASGICSMGADVMLIGPLPTPGVAFVTKSMRADAGIMISASHNPYQDNGIKIFSADGIKLSADFELEIERLVQSGECENHLPTGDLIGKAYRIDDAIGRYLVFLKSQFSNDLDLLGTRVVLDTANGAPYKVAPLVFEELGAEVIRLGNQPNGLNINHNCGALHPEIAAGATVEFRADIGISLDGDGDRCILSDENGEIVDGDQIIGLCAIQMAKEGRLSSNRIVTTPMSNIGLEVALKKHGIQMSRAQVGDRHVFEMMKTEGSNLGGEQSGHLIFADHSTTGDGVVAALKVLEIMRKTGKPLSELKRDIQLFPQVCQNVRVSSKPPIEEFQEITESISDAESKLADRGRVFVRYSGTESLLRVLVEGENSKEIKKLSDQIVKSISKNIG